MLGVDDEIGGAVGLFGQKRGGEGGFALCAGRIHARARVIHARFGYGPHARNLVARMRARELARLDARMRWVTTRYVAYVRPAHPQRGHRHAWR